MSAPTLTPASMLSAIVLPITGSLTSVNTALPYKIYSDSLSPLYSSSFLSGAVDQVSYVYKKLGGDILDLEITEGNVYAAYEEAVLEYSYLVNIHQATNMLSDALGNTTGSFDEKGNLEQGALSSSLGGSHIALKYPKFDYSMTRRVGEGIGAEIGLNSSVQFSASFDVTPRKQDYDLQAILDSRLNDPGVGALAFSAAPNDDEVFTLIDAEKRSVQFKFDTTTNVSSPNSSPAVIGIDAANNNASDAVNAASVAALVVSTINSNNHLQVSASIDEADTKKVNLTQSKGGLSGNTVIVENSNAIVPTNFQNGADNFPYGSQIEGKRILIKKVYYKTPHAMWRFYGYYGGLNVVGNLSNYGQFSDDSTFQLVPAWQNKAQANAFEDAIYTRMSQYSYELKNNKIRLYPSPETGGVTKMWIEFSVPQDVWSPDEPSIDGVNNMNTLPIGNLPYGSINAIGKQWIRRFALSLCKEILGQVRSKFGSVPIPGESVTLNGPALLSEAKDEQNKLRDELKQTLSELTYAKMAEQDAKLLEDTEKVLDKVPNYIFVG
jgi:hypothetical protein